MTQVMLVVVAHPDDETFGTGSVIAHAAAAGARVVVCCATRGEAGEDVSGTTRNPEELARAREQELRRAAKVLGASDVVLLGFADSGMEGDMPADALAATDVDAVAARVAPVIEDVQPDVVVGFDNEGLNDHRDHIRIGEATKVAFARAAKPGARLYAWTLVRSQMDRWLAEMRAQGALAAYDGMELGSPDERITTIVDVADVADVRRAAIAEHKTQFSPYTGMSSELEGELLARDHFVRIVPPWEGGPIETSLL